MSQSFFDGSFKKKKIVNYNPLKNKVDSNHPNNLKEYKQQVAKSKNERAFKLLSEQSATKIKSYYKMFKVRKFIKSKSFLEKLKSGSDLTKVLLSDFDVNNANKFLTMSSSSKNLNYFSYLLLLQHTKSTQDATRLLRLLPHFDKNDQNIIVSAAARVSETWFRKVGSENLDLYLLPWHIVKRVSDSGDGMGGDEVDLLGIGGLLSFI